MSLDAETNSSPAVEERDYRLTRLYHPSHHTPALRDTEEWFLRVFGRSSRPLSEIYPNGSSNGYPTDYSTFTPINDVLFDSIDPKLYILKGVQRYATVDSPRLKGFGWYVEGMTELYRRLRELGFTIISQLDEIAEGDDPPTSGGSPMPLFFTVPDDAGLRYEFLPQIPFPLDHRLAPGWEIPPVSDDDPLGIEFASHHTVLTDQPARALRLIVDGLGGEVIHTGRNEVIGADSTYVRLADAVFEYAVPDEGTDAHADWRRDAPHDTYHSITFKVADLERVEGQLSAQGVGIRSRTEHTLVTDPETSIGVPWGFTTELVAGDARRVA